MLKPAIALSLLLPLAALAQAPPAAQPVGEEIGSWRLGCTSDRMTDRTACMLRHRDWVERPGAGAGLGFEIMERGGRLVPAVTARDLSLDSASRGLLALTGTAQLRFDRNAMMELPCGLEGRNLVCAPRAADAARAADELATAERALIRMSGIGSSSTATTEPTELRLASTSAALERLRRQQPPGTSAPIADPGLTLRDLLGRAQRLVQ